MLYRVIVESDQIKGLQIHLSPEQNHYLRRVIRLDNQGIFLAMDGKGNAWEAQLTTKGAEIIKPITENRELPVNVTLIVALPKGNGFDEIVRCTTELGVNRLLPVISDRTLLKPSANKIQRWRKIANEAVEQCERQIIPKIESPVSFSQAITEVSKSNYACYLSVARDCDHSLLSSLQQNSATEIVIATGAEGGWTPNEIQKAIANNFQPVSLGKRILRAVTAPIMVMSLVSAIYEN